MNGNGNVSGSTVVGFLVFLSWCVGFFWVRPVASFCPSFDQDGSRSVLDERCFMSVFRVGRRWATNERRDDDDDDDDEEHEHDDEHEHEHDDEHEHDEHDHEHHEYDTRIPW